MRLTFVLNCGLAGSSIVFEVTSWALALDAELVWLKFEASAVGAELCSKLTLEHETQRKEKKLK